MSTQRRDPVLVFRFALRERDWRLAWLLAGALPSSPLMRERLESELEGARLEPGPRSLASLQLLGTVIDPLIPEAGNDL